MPFKLLSYLHTQAEQVLRPGQQPSSRASIPSPLAKSSCPLLQKCAHHYNRGGKAGQSHAPPSASNRRQQQLLLLLRALTPCPAWHLLGQPPPHHTASCGMGSNRLSPSAHSQPTTHFWPSVPGISLANHSRRAAAHISVSVCVKLQQSSHIQGTAIRAGGTCALQRFRFCIDYMPCLASAG